MEVDALSLDDLRVDLQRQPSVGVPICAMTQRASRPAVSASIDQVRRSVCGVTLVNFMRDAEAGVREMARVTRPAGVVAACVWDYAGEMTLLRAFWDAAREVDPERAAAADEGA